MQTHAEQHKASESSKALNQASGRKQVPSSTFQSEDKRPEALFHGNLLGMVPNSARMVQMKTLQAMADQSPQVQKAARWQKLANHYSASSQSIVQKKPSQTVIQRDDLEQEFEGSATEVPGISPEEKAFAFQKALSLTDTLMAEEKAYVFKGLGGGGARRWRSSELRKFRDIYKTAARIQAFQDLDTAAESRAEAGTASADFEKIMGGNVAYEGVKSEIDIQLEIEAATIVHQVRGKVYAALKQAIIASFQSAPKNYAQAEKALNQRFKTLKTEIHTELKAKKDEVVGKDASAPQEGADTTEAGAEVVDRIVGRVQDKQVGQKSLQKAIDAPSINKGMKILGVLIDNSIPDSGETVELKISFIIPTGAPGLNVEIHLSGLAARGIDGATTAGVTSMGNPKRVEVSAKLSVGVGAEAIGLKSSAALGVFIRAGSDQGTEAALQALSYGAYRGAPSEAFQNLWAPEDKATEVRKKVKKKAAASGQQVDLPERTKRQRAEMWAAMIEEKYFKGTGTSTFADVGLAVDGGFGINLGAAKAELGFGEAVFSHYDEELLKKKLGPKFASRVLEDASAEERRKSATGEKKLALSGSLNLSIGAGSHEIGISLSVSGSAANNWGVEIVGGATTASDASPTDYDKIMNGWVTGLGEMLKKFRSTVDKEAENDSTGAWGNILQLTADFTSLMDVGSNQGIRSAMAKATESSVPASPFNTTVGGTMESGATEKVSALAASTQLQFVFTFGNSGGQPVIRFELRSKRGLDIGGGTPVKVSASKTTRLFAIGKEPGGKVQGEILGGRVG